jgi:hypothetical protein
VIQSTMRAGVIRRRLRQDEVGGVPLEVLRDTIQPFPTFWEIYVAR